MITRITHNKLLIITFLLIIGAVLCVAVYSGIKNNDDASAQGGPIIESNCGYTTRTIAPTCTSRGSTTYTYINDGSCKLEGIPANTTTSCTCAGCRPNCTYRSTTRAATCTSRGVTTYTYTDDGNCNTLGAPNTSYTDCTCTNCTAPPLPNCSYTTNTRAATCTSAGSTTYTYTGTNCTRSGKPANTTTDLSLIHI